MKRPIKSWKCPMCGKMTQDYPALSRKDNKTEICSDCGTQEAFGDFFGHGKSKVTENYEVGCPCGNILKVFPPETKIKCPKCQRIGDVSWNWKPVSEKKVV